MWGGQSNGVSTGKKNTFSIYVWEHDYSLLYKHVLLVAVKNMLLQVYESWF